MAQKQSQARIIKAVINVLKNLKEQARENKSRAKKKFLLSLSQTSNESYESYDRLINDHHMQLQVLLINKQVWHYINELIHLLEILQAEAAKLHYKDEPLAQLLDLVIQFSTKVTTSSQEEIDISKQQVIEILSLLSFDITSLPAPYFKDYSKNAYLDILVWKLKLSIPLPDRLGNL